MKIRLALAAALLVTASGHAQEYRQALGLQQAVTLGVDRDPWLAGSELRQAALADEAVAASSLPDPRLSLMAGNFPTDSYDINQEAMTQLGVGLSQMFPRGDTRELSRQQKVQLSEQEPLLRLDRRASVTANVAQLYLEVYRSQESIHLIEGDRELFEYLVDAARSSYSSALGRARQQDLVRAQLELTRLEDRLTELRLQRDSARQRLSEWVGAGAGLPLERALPELHTAIPLQALADRLESDQQAFELMAAHPVLQAFDQRIGAMNTGVDLARQKYKPEWSVNAQYGYRDEDTDGRDRADLLSLGVSVDLPLFTGNRQDRDYSAAVARAEALRTDRLLVARQLVAELQAAVARLHRLQQRDALYQEQLLPQMAEQAAAALSAYNSDEGDFAEAVRARIAELDAKIQALSVAVERLQAVARINYLLAGNSESDPGQHTVTGAQQ